MHLEEVLQHYGFNLSLLSQPEYQRAEKEYPIYLFYISATESLARWETLRNLVSEVGYWPVIGWDRFKTPPWEEEAVQDIIEAGLHVDIQQWFNQQWLELNGERMMLRREKEVREDDGKALSPFVFNLYQRWLPKLVPIALIPTVNFWDVPAYLKVSMNDWDPPDAVHVAIMKYWNKRWKAELVSMAPGVLEMRVLLPPTTIQEASALAKEQYTYAPDLVDQDLGGSLHSLAKILLNGHVWRFWWD